MAHRISATKSLLFVIDVQKKLAPAMTNGETAIANNAKLLQAASLLEVPSLVSEQYPQGIGHTVDPLSALIDKDRVFEKMTFSCMEEGAIQQALAQSGRHQLIVGGMETHVCVLQTVLDLLDEGYQVFVVADAVASRTMDNKELGLARMRQCGAQIVSTEMVLFEWLGRAGTDPFKQVLPLIK